MHLLVGELALTYRVLKTKSGKSLRCGKRATTSRTVISGDEIGRGSGTVPNYPRWTYGSEIDLIGLRSPSPRLDIGPRQRIDASKCNKSGLMTCFQSRSPQLPCPWCRHYCASQEPWASKHRQSLRSHCSAQLLSGEHYRPP